MAKAQPIGPDVPGWLETNAVPPHLVQAWKRDGFVILPGLFSPEQIARYNATVAGARATVDDGPDAHGYGGRIGQLHQKHPELLELPAHPDITGFLQWALGDEPVVSGSLQFECGTQQAAHIDAIYFYPDPIWSMAGVWIALEDIHEDAGPLFYIPGSHRAPFSHSDDIVADKPDLAARREAARNGGDRAVLPEMEAAWHADLAARTATQPVAPILKAGDAVIWHSLLAHGGMPRVNPALSRRSAVFHFFGKNARLLTFDQFMLYGQAELRDQPPLVRPLRRHGALHYHHTGSWISYGAGGETVNLVKEPTGFAVGDPAPDDRALVHRIAADYREAMKTYQGPGVSMWQQFEAMPDKVAMAQALAADDIDTATQMLRNPAANRFNFGYENLVAEYCDACRETGYAAQEYAYVHGLLMRLAEVTGAIPFRLPGDENPPAARTPDELVSAISNALGCEIDFPNPYPDEFGIRTSRGLVGHRASQSIYQAWRVRELLREIGGKRVLEIGAGLGRTAYYAHRMGIADYTIVDIPISGVASSYFLGRTLGDHPIRVKAPEWLFASREQFDVVLNADSITEIQPEVAQRYMDHAIRHSRAILSINHEVNTFVVRKALQNSPGRYARHACWMREGYAEETFRPHRRGWVQRALRA